MQLPTLSVDAVQDKFVVVCVVPEGVKDAVEQQCQQYQC
jgi:hypothetical protein